MRSLFEIEKNLKTLENQAKKAERYYRLKDQYKEQSLALASFRIAGFRESLKTLEDQELQQAADKLGIVTQLDGLEATLQKQKLDNLTKEKNLSAQQKAANEFLAKIRAYESEKKLKNEQLRFLEDKKSRLTEELERDQNQLNHVIYNQKRLNEEHVQETSFQETFKVDVGLRKNELDELRLDQKKAKTVLDTANRDSADLQNKLHELEKNIAILNIQKDALSQESKRNAEDAQSKEIELTDFNRHVQDLQNRLEIRQMELETGLKLEEELQLKIIHTAEVIHLHKEQLNQESRKLDSKQNEYNLTKSLVDNLEGFPESVRFLKKNTHWAKQAPLFSDVLFCKEEYRIAIENYLEPVMNHYVVESQAEAVQAIRLLNDSSKGRANFFILDAVRSVTKLPSIKTQSEKLISALEIITVDEKYSRLCEMLLYNVYVLQSGEEEELNTSLPSEQVVILSGSGKFSKFKTGMSGGSVGLFEGKRLGRAKNLENLTKELKALEAEMNGLKTSIEQGNQKLNSLKLSSRQTVLQQIQQDINRLNNEHISVKTRQEQYVAFIENSQNREQDIELKIISISNELMNAEPQLLELRTQKQIHSDRIINLQQQFTELTELITEKSVSYNNENIRFHQQLNKVSGIEKDLEYRESQYRNLETRIQVNQTELEKILAGIKEALQHTDHSDEDLLGMYAQKEELEKGVLEQEQEYYASRGLINELENDITLLRRKKDHADILSNELKDQKNNLKIDLNALKERLSVEFSVDISYLLDEEPDTGDQKENESGLKEKTDRLKRLLDEFGAINPMAMEAYKEMNDRYNFIQAQKKDLADARASLMQTIKEIDDTAREKFMEAFVKIRESFIEVFRSLFNEEDSCDLVLSDPANPLESDIDILARPKGKRPLSINQLSGGEKNAYGHRPALFPLPVKTGAFLYFR